MFNRGLMSKISLIIPLVLLLLLSGGSQSQDLTYFNILQNVFQLMNGATPQNVNFTNIANVLSQISQSNVLQTVINALNQFNNSAPTANVTSFNLADIISRVPQISQFFNNTNSPNANGIISALFQARNFSQTLQSMNLSSIQSLLKGLTNAGIKLRNGSTSGGESALSGILEALSTSQSLDLSTIQNLLKVLTSSGITLPNGTASGGGNDLSGIMEALSATQSLDLSTVQNLLKVLTSSGITLPNGTASGEGNNALLGIMEALSAVQQIQYQISETCLEHAQMQITALLQGQLWALKMVDAMGKIPTGILDGNLKSLGSFEECKSVTATVIDRRNQTIRPFRGKYCTFDLPAGFLLGSASLESLGPWAYYFMTLKSGVCIPESCTNTEFLVAINQVLSRIPLGNITLFASSATCQENDMKWDTKAIAAIVMCGVFVLLMVIGTGYDVIYIQRPKDKAKADMLKYKNNGPPNNNTTNTVSDSTTMNIAERDKIKEQTPGVAGKLIVSFSMYTNGKKLLNTKQGAGSITAINGIRFFSMTWVILGHTLAFVLQVGNTENFATFGVEIMNRWTYTAIVNALISVDTFFALSGLLMSYLVLRELEKKKGPRGINWFMFYFHRFWRLTPIYMLVLFVSVATFKYWSDGPMWPQNGIEIDECRDTWWTNLLYINNLYLSKKPCFGWSWYLANDMQFYIVSPILFIPLFYNKIVGLIVCAVFLIGTTVASGVVSSINNLGPSSVGGGPPGSDVAIYMDAYYIKPWCRMGPYIIGIMTGYLLYKTKCKIRINKFVNIGIWLVAAGAGCAILYGLFEPLRGNNLLSKEVSALYNATHRTVWGLCVCWVIVSCASGHGGYVNKLLSWKAFVPLARLTYAAYLIHPLIMFLFYYTQRSPLHLTDMNLIYLFFGHLVASYGLGFVVSLAFESPMMGLEKVIFGRLLREKPKKQKQPEEKTPPSPSEETSGNDQVFATALRYPGGFEGPYNVGMTDLETDHQNDFRNKLSI